jgi:hypothetical protein
MGNCCRRVENWLCPNPFEGIVIEALYSTNYTTRSVHLGVDKDPVSAVRQPMQTKTDTLQPIQPTLTVHTEMLPEKESAQLDPLLRKPFLTPKSSPLYLGRPVVPPPPAFSLLDIAKNKKLIIEY